MKHFEKFRAEPSVKRRLPLAVLLTLLLNPPFPLRGDISLPTPPEHYENFNPAAEASGLVSSVLSELEPSQQSLIFQVLGATKSQSESNLSKASAIALLKAINWSKWRAQVLEQLLHRSQILEMIPEDFKDWRPIVHDALLFFLDHLGEERLLERVLDQADLRGDAPRGQRLLSFLSNTPTLQKIGQVLARNPNLPQDFREALQVLENSLTTANPQELVEFVVQEIGPDTVQKYQIEFSNKILAEATVGAVMQCRLLFPGQSKPTEAVLKVIKPYAITAMQEELAIFDKLTEYFAVHRDFYEIGAIPLAEMFEELREALSKEIQVINEQQNLRQAKKYYARNKDVLVPELYPFSTERVTFMEMIHGEKITDAFPGQRKARAQLARQLIDVMIIDVLFSSQEEALFHGDPHAGNVFHALDDPQSPYRIALLDWGLSGVLPRQQRESLMQLLLGIHLRDTKRLTNHVGSVVEGDDWKSPQKRETISRIVQETLSEKRKEKAFDILGELLKKLARQGYQIRFNVGLFIKSQITMSGILAELDPKLKQNKHLMQRFSRQVLKEMPKRLLYTVWFPGWNSHDYRSMLSNEDVKDLQVNSSVGLLKKAGNVLWKAVRWPVEVFIR